MLSVVSVAYPLAAVDRDPVGGAEQILSAIDRALVSAGHRSLVLACRGSTVSGQLVPVDIGTGPLTAEVQARAARSTAQVLEQLLAREQVDLVHFHGSDCGAYLPDTVLPKALPKLVTLHVPMEWYGSRLFQPELGVSFSCVSDWQRRQVESVQAVRATIYNGVDLERWQPLPEPHGQYALCLGRICPEKGFDVALRAAHQAGVPLLLAGQVFAYADHERYFAECILPLLDAERRFIGPVAGDAKQRLLAHARCVIVPSHVAETSSLVSMEALACGTPVIVSGAGAPHSLIVPGLTGFVAADEASLVAALQRVQRLDRQACRSSAEQRFDLRHTTRRYLELYRELVQEPQGMARRVACEALG
jgi:glycosyltransferase involved in cell wall biosynthesis